MKITILPPHILQFPFTGITNRVNQPAGKDLRGFCLLTSRANLRESGGDAKSLKAGLGYPAQGQLRCINDNHLKQEKTMYSSQCLKIIDRETLSKTLLASLFVASLFVPIGAMAHDGDLLKDEITAVEKLFTGGYMRIGLLGVCGFAAIYGIIKQSGWIFASGVLGCVFAYFMKDWILRTFALVI